MSQTWILFFGKSSFNSDISNWNVGAVTNMQSMFNGASSFNSDISNWNVSALTSMQGMFQSASSFNSTISNVSNWNVERVTTCSACSMGHQALIKTSVLGVPSYLQVLILLAKLQTCFPILVVPTWILLQDLVCRDKLHSWMTNVVQCEELFGFF